MDPAATPLPGSQRTAPAVGPPKLSGPDKAGNSTKEEVREAGIASSTMSLIGVGTFLPKEMAVAVASSPRSG